MSETRPHGKRVSRAEVAARMELVDELLQQGHAPSDVRSQFKARWKAGDRTVDEYIRRVRQRWASEAKEARATVRAATVKRLQRCRRELWAKGACSQALQVERMLIDIQGLKTPEPEPEPEKEEIPWWDLVAECTTPELEMLHRVMGIAEAKKEARSGKKRRDPALPPYPTEEPIRPAPATPPATAQQNEPPAAVTTGATADPAPETVAGAVAPATQQANPQPTPPGATVDAAPATAAVAVAPAAPAQAVTPQANPQPAKTAPRPAPASTAAKPVAEPIDPNDPRHRWVAPTYG